MNVIFKNVTIESINALTSQEIGNVFQLWNVVLAIVTVLYEQRKYMVVFAARVCFVQFSQFFEHDAPCVDLLLCVFDMWQFLAMFVIERNVSEIFSLWR